MYFDSFSAFSFASVASFGIAVSAIGHKKKVRVDKLNRVSTVTFNLRATKNMNHKESFAVLESRTVWSSARDLATVAPTFVAT